MEGGCESLTGGVRDHHAYFLLAVMPENPHCDGTVYIRSPEMAFRRQVKVDSDFVIHRLQDAGMTMMALPSQGARLAIKVCDYGYVREAAKAHPLHAGKRTTGNVSMAMRLPDPDARAIGRMDEAFTWLAMIENMVTRKIVAVRSLTNPATGREVYSWVQVGKMIGASDKPCKLWYGKGINIIVTELQQKGIFHE